MSRDQIKMAVLKMVWVVLGTLACCWCGILAFDNCIPVDPCSCRMESSGAYISLQEIDVRSSSKPRFEVAAQIEKDQFKYLYNPCTTFVKGSFKKGALGYQTDLNGNFVKDIADPVLSVTYDTQYNNYIFNYQGSSPDGQRAMKIILDCPTESTEKTSLGPFLESPKSVYTATLTSKCACPRGCKYDSSYFPKSSKHLLSTGSVLCIIFAVLIAVYLVVGVLVNKFVRHLEGTDLIPNKEFWVDFPAAVKDGCSFTIQKIRRKDTMYEPIK